MPIIISSQQQETQKERLIEENVKLLITPPLKDQSFSDKGTLSICENRLCWNDGLHYVSIDYPTIIIHAMSNEIDAEPVANIYCQLSSSVFVDDCGIPLQSADMQDSDYIEECDQMPIELRIVPADSDKVGQIYEIISECQQLNPDPVEEGEGGWITQDNVDSFMPNLVQQVYNFD